MKRLLATIVTLALILSLTACGGSGDAQTPEPPEQAGGVTNEGEMPAYEALYTTMDSLCVVANDAYEVTYVGYDDSQEDAFLVYADLVNHSPDVSYTFSAEVAINGITRNDSTAQKLLPGESRTTPFYIDLRETRALGVEEITDVSLSLTVVANDQWENAQIVGDVYHIYPKGKDKAEPFRLSRDGDAAWLLDSPEVAMAIVGTDTAFAYNQAVFALNFYLENKTEHELYFSQNYRGGDLGSANGGYFGASVPAGCTKVLTIGWDAEELQPCGITAAEDIHQVEFGFDVDAFEPTNRRVAAITTKLDFEGGKITSYSAELGEIQQPGQTEATEPRYTHDPIYVARTAIFSAETYGLEVLGVEISEEEGFLVRGYVKNTSPSETYLFSMDATFNGVQTDHFAYFFVAPGQEDYCAFRLDNSRIDQWNVGEYTDISLNFYIYDSNGEKIEEQTARIYPKGEANATLHSLSSPGTLMILDETNFRAAMVKMSYAEGWQFMMYLENNMDYALNFDLGAFPDDVQKAVGAAKRTLKPHTRIYLPLHMSDEDMKAAGISDPVKQSKVGLDVAVTMDTDLALALLGQNREELTLTAP